MKANLSKRESQAKFTFFLFSSFLLFFVFLYKSHLNYLLGRNMNETQLALMSHRFSGKQNSLASKSNLINFVMRCGNKLLKMNQNSCVQLSKKKWATQITVCIGSVEIVKYKTNSLKCTIINVVHHIEEGTKPSRILAGWVSVLSGQCCHIGRALFRPTGLSIVVYLLNLPSLSHFSFSQFQKGRWILSLFAGSSELMSMKAQRKLRLGDCQIFNTIICYIVSSRPVYLINKTPQLICKVLKRWAHVWHFFT